MDNLLWWVSLMLFAVTSTWASQSASQSQPSMFQSSFSYTTAGSNTCVLLYLDGIYCYEFISYSSCFIDIHMLIYVIFVIFSLMFVCWFTSYSWFFIDIRMRIYVIFVLFHWYLYADLHHIRVFSLRFVCWLISYSCTDLCDIRTDDLFDIRTDDLFDIRTDDSYDIPADIYSGDIIADSWDTCKNHLAITHNRIVVRI